MYVDSCITDQVLTVATNHSLPVLGIHDSFIVARDQREDVTTIMDVAAREIIGSGLKVEVAEGEHHPTRSEGYLSRLSTHRTRYG